MSGVVFAPYDPAAHGHSLDAVIRPAVPPDVEGCVRLAMLNSGGDIDVWDRTFGNAITDPQRLLLVAMASGRPVGYAQARPMRFGAGARNLPDGWYLSGIVVDPLHRRGGLGRRLTAARLSWLDRRTSKVWYFASAQNRASLELHARLGFHEVTRDFDVPGVSFTGGGGVLCVRGDA